MNVSVAQILLIFFTMIPMSGSQSENSDDFEKPIRVGNRFENPKSFVNWGGIPGFTSLLKVKMFDEDKTNAPADPAVFDKTIPVTNLTKFESKSKSSLFAAWLGHATVLVELEGIRFITDPVWAERASPLPSLVGPLRYRPPPMEIENLPELHFGVISHDHYDHLDEDSVQRINKQNPNMKWFVPLGMKKWFNDIGITNNSSEPDKVRELSWGESAPCTVNNRTVTIWSVPAQHWGKRGPFDTNVRLWSGYAIIGEKKRFYFPGDTGFCENEFRKIGNKLGPFDLAAIPIGAYEPRWFMKSQHINPEEAVKLHELVKSKMSIGIHWGTYYMGSYEYYLEPKEKLHEIMKNNTGLNPFVTIQMGKIWEDK